MGYNGDDLMRQDYLHAKDNYRVWGTKHDKINFIDQKEYIDQD